MPIVNRRVNEKLNGTTLILSKDGEQLECNKLQSIVWALISIGRSYLRDIRYQLNTLLDSDPKGQIDRELTDFVYQLVEIGFIRFIQFLPGK